MDEKIFLTQKYFIFKLSDILNNSFHTLVFGSMGSGKTQTITLPLIRLSISAGESFIVNDSNGELYKKTASKLESEGYSINEINVSLNNFDCNNYALQYVKSCYNSQALFHSGNELQSH